MTQKNLHIPQHALDMENSNWFFLFWYLLLSSKFIYYMVCSHLNFSMKGSFNLDSLWRIVKPEIYQKYAMHARKNKRKQLSNQSSGKRKK